MRRNDCNDNYNDNYDNNIDSDGNGDTVYFLSSVLSSGAYFFSLVLNV